jgi:hypothetical protein
MRLWKQRIKQPKNKHTSWRLIAGRTLLTLVVFVYVWGMLMPFALTGLVGIMPALLAIALLGAGGAGLWARWQYLMLADATTQDTLDAREWWRYSALGGASGALLGMSIYIYSQSLTLLSVQPLSLGMPLALVWLGMTLGQTYALLGQRSSQANSDAKRWFLAMALVGTALGVLLEASLSLMALMVALVALGVVVVVAMFDLQMRLRESARKRIYASAPRDSLREDALHWAQARLAQRHKAQHNDTMPAPTNASHDNMTH